MITEEYMTENYKVIFTDESDIDKQYQVVSNINGAIEYASQNRPQALTVCEQFNAILDKKYYEAKFTLETDDPVGDLLDIHVDDMSH